jgi:hypothetical protein
MRGLCNQLTSELEHKLQRLGQRLRQAEQKGQVLEVTEF